MPQIKKIEEVIERRRFDTIVKFDSRTIVRSGTITLAEIRIKGRTCYFYVIEKCAHERAVKLVRFYAKRMNGVCKTSAVEEEYLLAA